jgi:hypothetical protein
VLSVVLKWVGVALLLIASLLAISSSGIARRMGGASRLSLKRFHSRRMR